MGSQSESPGITILITDDSPVYVKLMEKILEKNRYGTLTAMDGTACLKTAKSLNPDLILLDVIMPGINGFEVCRVLKQDMETKDIPIIFVTSNTDDNTLKKAFMAGGTDYVRKPPNRIELLARIKSALAQKELVEKRSQEEKLKGVLEMAGAVCHEMNQPLQAMFGIAEILLMDISKDDPQYRDLEKLREQAVRLGNITKKLMTITKYETRDYVGEKKIIDIDKASA